MLSSGVVPAGQVRVCVSVCVSLFHSLCVVPAGESVSFSFCIYMCACVCVRVHLSHMEDPVKWLLTMCAKSRVLLTKDDQRGFRCPIPGLDVCLSKIISRHPLFRPALAPVDRTELELAPELRRAAVRFPCIAAHFFQLTEMVTRLHEGWGR